MARLGPCTLSIGPHTFEIVLYAVKAQQVPAAVSSPHEPAPTTSVQQERQPDSLSQKYASGSRPLDHRSPSTIFAPRRLASADTAASPGANLPQHRSATQQAPQPPGVAPQAVLPHHSQRPTHSPSQAFKPSPDPVIQLLATRAATDDDLKSLMTIVASGKASSAQLKTFQAYIDELSAIVQANPHLLAGHLTQPRSSSNTTSRRHLAPSHGSTPSGPPHRMGLPLPDLGGRFTSDPNHKPRGASRASEMIIKAEQSGPYQSSRHPLGNIPRRDRSLPPAHSDIKAVLMEFTAGSGDRYLFPKYSILHYSPDGTSLTASILVQRKGNESKSDGFDPKLEYHQSITMCLFAASARVVEPLTRIVASVADVTKQMNEVMARTVRAPPVYLPLRLPRDSESVNEPSETVGNAKNDTINTLDQDAFYIPPGSLGPLYNR